MVQKLKDLVGNIFHREEQDKAEEQKKTAALQQTTNNVFGTTQNT